MKFWVFEPSAVPWTQLSIGAAVLLAASVGCQVYALWRALQLADDMVGHYQRTLRWLLAVARHEGWPVIDGRMAGRSAAS
jgi:hypothetical protein